LRPLLPTLQLLSLPPLWPLLVTELALVLVSVPLVATLPESLVLVLSATVPVLVLSATELALLAFTKHSANVLFLLLSMICYLNKELKGTYLTLHIVYLR